MSDDAGVLRQIWIKRVRRGVMDAAGRATIAAGRGIVGNANQGGRRQVTILEAERWDAYMRELGGALPTSARRANLVVERVALAGTRGRVLCVGACRLRILGETKPCERMDEAFAGLKNLMYADWGGGAFAEALDDGEIAVGDAVRWEAEA